ncbi:hypothetical protein FNV43_RR09675 [Rhamnella rubrinervis]|uniref:C2H2-type domain-containing protein n=1 Tax=Rhamnella rubrinervis TaxID=2594499 RepID=A0A8K0MKK8_9ROSA|nr:hypothetical protein FNV43_RR09675 [Rhamnella rubrinervis]
MCRVADGVEMTPNLDMAADVSMACRICSFVFNLGDIAITHQTLNVHGGWTSNMDKADLLSFGATLLYTIWKVRCEFFFEGEINLYQIIRSFNCSVEYYAEIGKKKEQPIAYAEESSSMIWRPPQRDFIKVNVDAMFVKANAAAAMVVRDDQGHVLFLASKLFKCNSPFDAEVETLSWAAAHVELCD